MKQIILSYSSMLKVTTWIYHCSFLKYWNVLIILWDILSSQPISIIYIYDITIYIRLYHQAHSKMTWIMSCGLIHKQVSYNSLCQKFFSRPTEYLKLRGRFDHFDCTFLCAPLLLQPSKTLLPIRVTDHTSDHAL